MPSVPFTQGLTHHIAFGTHAPWPWLAGMALCLAAGLVWLGLAMRSRPGARLVLALRAVSLCMVLFLGLLPEWVTQQTWQERPHVAVLVDDSPSMRLALGAAPGAARLPWAQKWAQAARALGDGAGDDKGSPSPRSVSLHSLPDAHETDLLAGLDEAIAQGLRSGHPPDALILLSDGADHGRLTLDAPSDQAITAAAAAQLLDLGVPVSTLTVPTQVTPFVDVAIDHVAHDPYGFIKNTQTIGVTLSTANVPPGTKLALTLRQDDAVVATATAAVAVTGPTTGQLSFVPTQVGTFAYRIDVAPIPGEATWVNNSYRYVARVVRDKIRVLHVAGRPSWDQRFLRETLKAQTQVDLVSFYILRTPYSDNAVSENELSLIPFPVERLFTTELKNFDAVIFQNFDSRPFRMEGYLPNLAQAIEQGLGFMMVGGADSFGQAGYGGTPLEAVLPTRVGGPNLIDGPATIAATPAGSGHPLLNICPGHKALAQCLPDLPVLTRINPLGAPHPDATVLAQAQSTAPDAWHGPWLVAREAHKGRTLSLACDTLWHWRVHDGPLSQAAKAYEAFWHQALAWLTHDPETLPLQVLPSKTSLAPDEPIDVALVLQTAGDLQAPAQPGTVTLEILPLEKSALEPKQQAAGAQTCTATWSAQGQASCRLLGRPPGAYRLRARTSGHRPMEAEATVVVQGLTQELTHLAARPALMARIATLTGGSILTAASLPEAVFAVPTAAAAAPTVIGAQRTPLWDNGYVLLAVGATLLATYLLGRRAGLP